MNKAEKQLLNNSRELLEDKVDPVTVSDGLFDRHILSANQRKCIYDLSRSHLDRSDVWRSLYTLISSQCNLQTLLLVLLDAGYTEIALSIGQKLRMLEHRPSDICRIYRTKTGDASQRFAQKLFMNFKINTHNNAFVNPRQYCHEESQKYRIQLERYTGGDEEVKQGIADKYVACLLAEIDSHIMLYTRQFPAYQLIKQLKQTIPQTSNSNITQLSYESRVAMACALSGKETEGEEHLQRALGMSLLAGRCVEISNLLYIYVFNLLSLYEKCPTKQLRDKIIHIAEMGIQSVEDETDSIREFWFRLFILRIIYCLLGLSYRGDPIYGIVIDKLSIRKAKQMLTEVDRQWKGMETRRKIMYYVSKARIAELEQSRDFEDTVLYYLNLAIDIGNDGDYGETQFVKRYASYFQPFECKAHISGSSEAIHQVCFESDENTSSTFEDNTSFTDIMNNLQLTADKTSETKLHDHNETSVKLLYTDEESPKQHIPLQIQKQSDNVANKIPNTASNQIYAMKTRVVETFGTVKIYDNTIVSNATYSHEDTVLKELNIKKHGNEAVFLTRHSDNTSPKEKTDTDEDVDTNPKRIIDSNNVKECTDANSEQNSLTEEKNVLQSIAIETGTKTLCKENTTVKSFITKEYHNINDSKSFIKGNKDDDFDQTSSKVTKQTDANTSDFHYTNTDEDTKVKDLDESGNFGNENKDDDYDQTSTKTSKQTETNPSDSYYTSSAVLDQESLPFYDIHICDQD